MKKTLLLFLCLVPAFCHVAICQEKISVKPANLIEHPKGSFTLSWGYNKDYFSKSDIHFSSPDYNFTLYGITASDRPAPFSFKYYFNPEKMWVPQYNYRVGYFLRDQLCLSLGMDHMKYVMNSYQDVKISGTISSGASEKYHGTYKHETISISPEFLTFEHTNGFNLLSFDADYFQPVLSLIKKRVHVSFITGMGIGGMIPKTEVYVFGKGADNRFHLAGYSVSARLGMRINILKWFFISGEIRNGYASLPSVLINNNSTERASHSLWFEEYSVVTGVRFRIGQKSD